MPKVKFIYFDIGKVLIDYDFNIIFNGLKNYTQKSLQEVEQIYDKHLRFHLIGELSTKDFYNKLTKELEINQTKLTQKKFFQIFDKFFIPKPDVINLLTKINPKIPKGIISDIEPYSKKLIEKQPFIKFFPKKNRLYSFQVGITKPNPKIYQKAISQTGFNPKEILYIDNFPHFVEAFKKLGGNGIVFDCSEEDHLSLEKKLSEYKLMK